MSGYTSWRTAATLIDRPRAVSGHVANRLDIPGAAAAGPLKLQRDGRQNSRVIQQILEGSHHMVHRTTSGRGEKVSGMNIECIVVLVLSIRSDFVSSVILKQT